MEASPFKLLKTDIDGKMNPYSDEDYAWLAMEWFFQNGRRNPTRLEIMDGILEQVSNQIRKLSKKYE